MEYLGYFQEDDSQGIKVKLSIGETYINASSEELKKSDLVYVVAYMLDEDEKALLVSKKDGYYLIVKESEEGKEVFNVYKLVGEKEEVLDEIESYLGGHLPKEITEEDIKRFIKLYRELPIKKILIGVLSFLGVVLLFVVVKNFLFKKEEAPPPPPPPRLSKKEQEKAGMYLNQKLIEKINELAKKVDGNISAIKDFIGKVKVGSSFGKYELKYTLAYLYPVPNADKEQKVEIANKEVKIFLEKGKAKKSYTVESLKAKIGKIKLKKETYARCLNYIYALSLNKDLKILSNKKNYMDIRWEVTNSTMKDFNYLINTCPLIIESIKGQINKDKLDVRFKLYKK